MTAPSIHRRSLLAALAVLALAGCQTIRGGGFSAAQRKVLEAKGFQQVEGRYLLGFNNRLLFAFDSSDIAPDQQLMLRELASELAAVGIGGATVEGHASAEGDPRHNLRLSGHRAEAVSAALVAGGLDSARVRARAMGADDPIASNADIEGRQQNRRVVIIVTPADALPR